MARHESTARRTRPSSHDLEAAFDRCGAGSEALRECVLACRRSARRALDAELARLLIARGHDAREPCTRELTARLEDLSVGDLLQMISMGRKDGLIEVVHGALVSRIWCAGGEIIDAVSGRLQGEAAAYRILGLDHGELLADFRRVQRQRVIATSTQELMLEAARRKDECSVLQRRLGGARRVYSSVPSAAAASGVGRLESDALAACTPGAAIDEVLASSAQADLETLQAVSALVERGCLVASEQGAARGRPAVEASAAVKRWAWSILGDRWSQAWVVLGTCALLGVGAVLIGVRQPAPRLAEQSTGKLSATTLSARPNVSAAVPPVPRASYAVEVAVEPVQAGFWLDGELVGAGDLSILLARDGRMHELRIDAAEHVARTLLFRDVSPPRAVALERVPTAPE